SPIQIAEPMQEIASGPSCWLWDYLRRSGASGFFVPLSGGADSAAVVTIVGAMAQEVCTAMEAGDECQCHFTSSSYLSVFLIQFVISEVERVTRMSREKEGFPKQPAALCNILLHTCFMGSTNSSSSTRQAATALAEEIGAFHFSIAIDSVVSAFLSVFQLVAGRIPKYSLFGGTPAEDLALQNIQARIRMVFSYLFSSLLPWIRSKTGYLLVLGTGNVDEALRGYLTKYDCSSADINPIGSISKVDLRAFLRWSVVNLGYNSLIDIVNAQPTAELRPIDEATTGKEVHTQTDEDDMGLTYEELGIFGKLRKVLRCGPVSMMRSLALTEKSPFSQLSLAEVAGKVKHFFSCYASNRHKMTTLTPSYHAEAYSPDDNRFDHRQFLYPPFETQFAKIDEIVSGAPQ
ncbi:uncharacterized protein LOC129617270, partial [Condylostylus longicornis]|uniref:uncharacterized protein LOC129617270 n=1 Tax=Condylostylus longicornis TaxID=2530218 RepID=UPI00244E11A2